MGGGGGGSGSVATGFAGIEGGGGGAGIVAASGIDGAGGIDRAGGIEGIEGGGGGIGSPEAAAVALELLTLSWISERSRADSGGTGWAASASSGAPAFAFFPFFAPFPLRCTSNERLAARTATSASGALPLLTMQHASRQPVQKASVAPSTARVTNRATCTEMDSWPPSMVSR